MRNGPDFIQFYPTLRCNRSCDFCFNRFMPAVQDMSLRDFGSMLDVLTRVSANTIDVIGGEPTMHPDILGFIRESVGAGFSVNLSTNGSDLNVLEKIMGLGTHVTVGISVNDRGTLNKVRGFIQQHKPVVKTIFSRGMDRDMIKEILSLEPKRFYLIYRDTLDKNELQAAIPFYRFKSEVDENFNPRQVGMVYCSGFLPGKSNYPEPAHVRCPAGTSKLGVMPDGSVYPCNLFFGMKDFLLGNILIDSFGDIWSHEALGFFRTAGANACSRRACKLHAECHGGCPALSLLIAGDLAAADPRCYAE